MEGWEAAAKKYTRLAGPRDRWRRRVTQDAPSEIENTTNVLAACI